MKGAQPNELLGQHMPFIPRTEEFTGSSSLFRATAWSEAFVPGIDFRAVREGVSMSEILELIGYTPSGIRDDVMRGPCPIHRSKSSKSRSFAVNLKRKVFHCFTCGVAGNHLDLYAAVSQKRVFEAAIDLCVKLHRQVPWLQLNVARDCPH